MSPKAKSPNLLIHAKYSNVFKAKIITVKTYKLRLSWAKLSKAVTELG